MFVAGCLSSTAHAGRRVGAVMHTPRNATTAAGIAAANAAVYVNFATRAATEQLLELLVYPEFGLYGPDFMGGGDKNCAAKMGGMCNPVPLPGASIDCTAAAAPGDALKILACGPQASTYANVTLSVNLCEVSTGQPGTVSGSHYNTQVVLRGTTVVAVYRKRHPWDTTCFATPALEVVSFRLPATATNPAPSKRIGVFTCFDIAFPDPKNDLVAEGVRHFAYASAIPLAEVPVDGWSLLANVTVVNANLQLGWSAVYRDGHKLAGCEKSAGECKAVAELSDL